MKTDTKHQHAIKIVFTSSRELTNDEIDQLIARLELEVAEPQIFDDSDPTNLSIIQDAEYSTSDTRVAYENLTLIPTDERIIGSINQFPAR